MSIENIKNINIKKLNKFVGDNNMKNNIPTFAEQVENTVKTLKERAEREVAEYGDFMAVTELFPNLDKETQIGNYALKIFKMPKDVVSDPKKRYLEAAIYMPSGDYKMTMVVGSGTKQEILDMLNQPDFCKKLNKIYGELLYTIEHS